MKKHSPSHKVPKTKISFTATQKMENQLLCVAQNKGISLSELIRRCLEKSLRTEFTEHDADFLREQIKEEMTTILDMYLKEMKQISKNMGAYMIPQCLFSADIIQLFVQQKHNHEFNNILKKAQEDAIIILSEE